MFLKHVLQSRELVAMLGGAAGLRLINALLLFLSSVVLARLLGPIGYGDYSFGMTVASLLALLATLGVSNLLTRESARYHRSGSYALLQGLLRRSRQGVLLTSALVFASAQCALTLFDGIPDGRLAVLRTAVFLVPLSALVMVNTGILAGLRHLRAVILTDSLIRSAPMICGAMALAYLGLLSAVSAVFLQIVCAVFALLLGTWYLGRQYPRLEPEFRNAQWLRAIGPFAWIAIVGYLNLEVVSLVLGVTHAPEELAYLRVAFAISMVVALPLSIIESMALPYITRFYDKRDMQGLHQTMRLVSQISVLLSAVPAALFLGFGGELLRAIFGEAYVVAYWPLVALTLGHLATNFLGLSMPLLYATDYHKEAARIACLGVLFALVLSMLLIPSLGAIGAAMAYGIGKVFRSILYLVAVRKYLRIGTTAFG